MSPCEMLVERLKYDADTRTLSRATGSLKPNILYYSDKRLIMKTEQSEMVLVR